VDAESFDEQRFAEIEKINERVSFMKTKISNFAHAYLVTHIDDPVDVLKT
jgi:hypothetical protein